MYQVDTKSAWQNLQGCRSQQEFTPLGLSLLLSLLSLRLQCNNIQPGTCLWPQCCLFQHRMSLPDMRDSRLPSSYLVS
jgi:hypothetical protein